MTTLSGAIRSLLGGVLIGISAALLLGTVGRIAGISGIVGRVFSVPEPGQNHAWRFSFISGLLVGGLVLSLFFPASLGAPLRSAWPGLAAAGLLVGVGTQLGNGCTSGHGVCGLARGSLRSLVATLVFMGVAGAVVFVERHVLGGAS